MLGPPIDNQLISTIDLAMLIEGIPMVWIM
jgi:hypothetical protein